MGISTEPFSYSEFKEVRLDSPYASSSFEVLNLTDGALSDFMPTVNDKLLTFINIGLYIKNCHWEDTCPLLGHMSGTNSREHDMHIPELEMHASAP